MQTLTDKAVHIHLLQPDGYVDATAEHILNPEEHQKAQKFRFPHDRNLYMAAHVFLRRALSRYAAVSPSQWQFNHNAYGKPAIANPDVDWLKFNLSHTHGMVACAITRDRAIGVDVEKINRSCDLSTLCQYVLTPLEAMDVLSVCDQHEPLDRFFTYWTLKEAYIKARGMGLNLPLQQFAFQQGKDHRWHLSCNPALQDKGENWQSDAFRVGANHHLAYCLQAGREFSHDSNLLIMEENSSSSIAWNAGVEITPMSC